MDMPRVAMYIWFFPPFIGGAEKQCKILSEELVKKGASIFIVTERIKNTRKFEVINGIEVYRVGSLNWLRRLPAYIRHFIRKRRDYYIGKLDNLEDVIVSASALEIGSLCLVKFDMMDKRVELATRHLRAGLRSVNFPKRITNLISKTVPENFQGRNWKDYVLYGFHDQLNIGSSMMDIYSFFQPGNMPFCFFVDENNKRRIDMNEMECKDLSNLRLYNLIQLVASRNRGRVILTNSEQKQDEIIVSILEHRLTPINMDPQEQVVNL